MFSNNSSKASEFFESKINYDNEVTSDIKERSIDMWYEVPYFGKIDTNGVRLIHGMGSFLVDALTLADNVG